VKIGDLVRLKWQGNGHPGIGLIVSMEAGSSHRECCILWDSADWSLTSWAKDELVVIDEAR